MYCSMPKGTSQEEVMSNSKKIKPVTLAVIKLCLSEDNREGSRQAGRQAVENSIELFFF